MTPEREAKAIREELAYIGRYLEDIPPKLSKYQELKTRQEVLRKRLKELKLSEPGTNPAPFRKKWTNFQDIAIPEGGSTNNGTVHKLARRSY